MNAEKRLQSMRTNYAENPEPIRRRTREWARSNPDKIAFQYIRRTKAAIGLTEAERKEVAQIYRARDALTAQTGIQHHVDHIIPISRGGKHHPSNLRVITATENMRKHARLLPLTGRGISESQLRNMADLVMDFA